MELHQLRYFVAVAEAGSFSRAAEHCCVSQPSLSQQIAKLERHLHQRLFDRLGSGIALTEAGRLLLEQARAILMAVDTAERGFQDADGTPGGHLSVGAIPTVAPYLLPPALDRFLDRHPDREVTVQEDVTRLLVSALIAGTLDLALIALPLEDERLHLEPLLTEPLLLALPPGHRLRSRLLVTWDDLREERFIVLNEMHCLGAQVLQFCQNACAPRIACRSGQIATVQALIARGLGISLLPAMARCHIPSDPLSYHALAGPAPVRTLAVAWHRQRRHGRHAQQFHAILQQMASAVVRECAVDKSPVFVT